jgi:diguanylate cyclase (GGDEF)-like protein
VASFEVLASLLCFARALVIRRGRVIPLVLGLALLSWSIGDMVLTADSIGEAAPPTPSLADVFYLTFYPLTYLGLGLLLRRRAKVFNVTWLDGAVAGLGAAAICAEFALTHLSHSLGGSTASVATNLAYPVGDLLLLALVVGGTTVLPGRPDGRWLLLAAGCAINAVGDTFNLFHSSIGDSHLGVVLNAVAWPTAILLVSASVWLRPRSTQPLTYERPPGFALPGIAALCALMILVTGSLRHGDGLALGLAAAALTLACVRCGFAIARLRTLTEERHAQAVTDQLTTLANRRALFELLDALFAEQETAEESGRRLALLFVDLNGFKEINDSLGHSVGDELLRELGARMNQCLRSSDLLVRLGGDEFGVAVLDAGADEGTMIAERITSRLDEPFLLGKVRVRISASIGIAVVPTDSADAHELLRCADLAMYRAKLDGKPFAIYQEELDGHGNRLGLVEDLRAAIESRELVLHYQPQADVASGDIVAVEALLRWPHPRLGYIPPLEFVPLAEEFDLMDPLTAFVVTEALAQCANWRRDGHRVSVAVNISTTNLLNPSFPEFVREQLESHELTPDALVLEITETTAMADIERCKQAIVELRDLGLGVSVDDFGAGATSLPYLSNLAISELKLDRGFVSGLTAGDQRSIALVGSTIKLAHDLGLRVVAEGVEHEDLLKLLSGLRCDIVQGYLISKPKPASELPMPAAVARPRVPDGVER